MPRLLCLPLVAPLLLAPLACKDPKEAQVQERTRRAVDRLGEGRAALEAGRYPEAVQAFKDAAFAAPTAVEPRLLLAEAHRRAGNASAALLALKEAEPLARTAGPEVQKQMAELYLQGGHREQALSSLVALRDARELSDAELLRLARLQAESGETEGAFATLEGILRQRPDDPQAKTVEAEVLLLNGEELLATRLLDRLLSEHPALVEARLVRARYFLNNGYPQYAEADLGLLSKEAASAPAAVTLKARVLNALGRHLEAEALLKSLLEQAGRTPELLGQLAETRVLLGRLEEAQALVDEALQLRPTDARAHYMRGRILEQQAQRSQAAAAYARAAEADGRFAPALSRLWRLQQEAGNTRAALDTLERLYFMSEASLEEKAALAGLYAETSTHLSRGRRLIAEALRREPGNARYRAIQSQLVRKSPDRGPVIIRGGR